MGTSMPDQNKFAWQRIIHEAMVELDPEKLKGKVAKAEAVIFERMQDFGPRRGPCGRAPRIAGCLKLAVDSEERGIEVSRLETEQFRRCGVVPELC